MTPAQLFGAMAGTYTALGLVVAARGNVGAGMGLIVGAVFLVPFVVWMTRSGP